MKTTEYNLEPFGSVLNDGDRLPSLKELMAQTRQHKLLLLRGYTQYSKTQLLEYCESQTELLHWDFGAVMEMKAEENAKNYLFTKGRVPLHWDGAFHQTPRFLLFHCIKAPDKTAGGETFFVDGEKVLEQLTEQEREQWRQLQLSFKTEKLAHYGGEFSTKLISQHPDTNKETLRFAEPVDDSYLNPVEVNVENRTDSTAIIEDITQRCYQPSVIYTHQWQEGDYLLVDNHALLHGRNEFVQNSARHLRRIQLL